MSNKLNEYRQDAVTPKTHRALKVTLIAIGTVMALTASTWVGSMAVTVYNADAVRHAQIVAQSLVPAAPVGSATTAGSQAQMAASDVAGGQAVVTEDAKIAAALAAKEAAARAAAIRAADTTQQGGSTQGASSGTPLGWYIITDPNNANYGQKGYDDPGTFCASGSASTINGVPTCD